MRKYLVAIGIIVLLVASSSIARAQEKLKEGDVRTGMVVLCEKVEDAATLIGLTTRYGRNVGMGYMQEEDNTCTMAPVTFTVGAVELAGVKDKQGAEWLILGITIEDKPHYSVIPSAMVATPASY